MKIETLFPMSPSLHHSSPLSSNPSWICLSPRALHPSHPFLLSEQHERKINCSTFILCSLSPPPLLSSLSLITSFTSLQKRFTSCGISSRKKRRKMLQGNYIYSECKKERKNTSEGWVWFHQGGVNANWVKRAERARTKQTEKKKTTKKTEAVGEFYVTKEKQVLWDEGIMAEKRGRKMRGRATWSILSNLKVNHFSRIKAGFRIPTVCVCVCVCFELVSVCAFACFGLHVWTGLCVRDIKASHFNLPNF